LEELKVKRVKTIVQNQVEIDENQVIYQECACHHSAQKTAENFAETYFAEKREIENFINPTSLNPFGSFNLKDGVNKYIICFAHYKDCLPMWKIIFNK
jgi:hypothetical protein